jgi:hypothetical protein
MKEQLISLSLAKLAKEKGFNIFSEYWYNGKEEEQSINYPGDEALSDYFDYTNNKNNPSIINILNGSIYLAPTQGLLQKWLREVHNIWINIYTNNLDSNFTKNKPYDHWILSFRIETLIDNKFHSKLMVDGFANSYEEALEQGLIESLKLIKT